mmetsp:Transcript_29100/g.68096  ORF Transcript_29100/g.68096 Transcript_29100/m.68096 type:complete len:111 (+) Transcript_29100:1189-1521(+)
MLPLRFGTRSFILQLLAIRAQLLLVAFQNLKVLHDLLSQTLHSLLCLQCKRLARLFPLLPQPFLKEYNLAPTCRQACADTFNLSAAGWHADHVTKCTNIFLKGSKLAAMS